MFKKKKEKKESGTSGVSSSQRQETTTSQNGTTIFRQTSTETRQVQHYSLQESYSVTHSSSTGAISSILNSDRRFSLEPNKFLNRFENLSIGQTSAPQSDARPFTTASSRRPIAAAGTPSISRGLLSPTTTSGISVVGTSSPSTYAEARSAFSYRSPYSYPSGTSSLRLSSTAASTLANQSAAQNPGIAQSVPASIVPTYSHSRAKLGKALIINNVKFIEKKDERRGAEKDSKDLKKLLKNIGFDVEHKTNLTANEILSKAKDFSKSNFSSYDMSLVVIMSHGHNVKQIGKEMHRIQGGYTLVMGVDDNQVLVDNIIDQFLSEKAHTGLKGKPKVFIFQCCRGEKDLEVCHDVTPVKVQRKKYSDVLLAFSTLPGYLSNRHPENGSWYIQSICQVFEKHYKSMHLEDMLKLVDQTLSQKHPVYAQTSTYENRGFKTCYLHKVVP